MMEALVTRPKIRAFDCEPLLLQDGRGTLVGTKHDIELAQWYYNFLKVRIAKLAETKFRLQRDRKSYGYGCVLAVGDRLEKMFKKAQEEVRSAETTALVVVKKEEVSKEFNRIYPKRIKKRGPKIDPYSKAFYKGHEDGKKMALNVTIGNNGYTKLRGTTTGRAIHG